MMQILLIHLWVFQGPTSHGWLSPSVRHPASVCLCFSPLAFCGAPIHWGCLSILSISPGQDLRLIQGKLSVTWLMCCKPGTLKHLLPGCNQGTQSAPSSKRTDAVQRVPSHRSGRRRTPTDTRACPGFPGGPSSYLFAGCAACWGGCRGAKMRWIAKVSYHHFAPGAVEIYLKSGSPSQFNALFSWFHR